MVGVPLFGAHIGYPSPLTVGLSGMRDGSIVLSGLLTLLGWSTSQGGWWWRPYLVEFQQVSMLVGPHMRPGLLGRDALDLA